MNPKKDELFDFIIKIWVPGDGKAPEGDVWHTGLRESCDVADLRRSRKERLSGHQSSEIKIMVPKK